MQQPPRSSNQEVMATVPSDLEVPWPDTPEVKKTWLLTLCNLKVVIPKADSSAGGTPAW